MNRLLKACAAALLLAVVFAIVGLIVHFVPTWIWIILGIVICFGVGYISYHDSDDFSDPYEDFYSY